MARCIICARPLPDSGAEVGKARKAAAVCPNCSQQTQAEALLRMVRELGLDGDRH